MVAHDITDRKQVETALREANRKLNLLSSVTRHDLLNQLTVLSGFLELSVPGVTGTRLEEYVDRELNAVGIIQRLIRFTKEYEEIGQSKPGWNHPEGIIRELERGEHTPVFTLIPGLAIRRSLPIPCSNGCSITCWTIPSATESM